MARQLKRIWRLVLVFIILMVFATNSGIPSTRFVEQVRAHTLWIEFDYVDWTLDAMFAKFSQAALGTKRYLNEVQQAHIMEDYLNLVREHRQLQAAIEIIYTDPNITDPEAAAEDYLRRQAQVVDDLNHLGLLAESVLQQQASAVIDDAKITFLGSPVPPVQFHTTPLPYALIVSPRSVIRQDADISLLPDLTLDEIVAVEKQVESAMDVSALVVPIGGVGVYPTMVKETTNFPWLTEVVSHEWTHNYLTWHPLGMLYMQSPELRTINETTANMTGKELGAEILAGFYPQYTNESVSAKEASLIRADDKPVFDYRAEMHETRVTADALLEEGKIEAAEAYMEARRVFFVENGYQIRRLNQAYFAFYGAYADTPGGAAGEDPVGAAVRQLRAESESLADFLHKIAWVTSYEGVLKRLETAP